jgi:hypothetical protein
MTKSGRLSRRDRTFGSYGENPVQFTLRELPQPPKHAERRERVPPAVSEQPFPQVGSLSRIRRLAVHEQRLERTAGRVAIPDLQVVVREPGHERWSDALEAEAPAEGGMVDVITDQGEQVHEAICDGQELVG